VTKSLPDQDGTVSTVGRLAYRSDETELHSPVFAVANPGYKLVSKFRDHDKFV
jgi:hypothetical protein